CRWGAEVRRGGDEADEAEPGASAVTRAVDDAEYRALLERRREQTVGPDPTDERAGRSRSLAEILTDPDARKPPPPVVPGLAWAGRITLVSAREGVGKSTLFAAAAAAITTGGEFL